VRRNDRERVGGEIAREPAVRQGGNRWEKKGEFSHGTSPGD